MTPPTRQEERSETTRRALVAAGRALFAERGFADTATEEIVARAGVTRGALYHHFRDKTDLFRAVYEELEQEMMERIAAAMSGEDVWEAIARGIASYLEGCRDPAVQRIAHADGPGVLGWDEWWEIGNQHGLGLIREVIQRAVDTGLMGPVSVDLVAHTVRGAIMEAGQYVSSHPDVDLAEVEQTLFRFLSGLLTGPAAPSSRD